MKLFQCLQGGYANIRSSCAALNGVDASVVERANELVELSAKGEDLVATCASISLQEEEDLKDAVGYCESEIPSD